MKISEIRLPIVFLKPGELHMGTNHVAVHTVLGSCVSVTMYNPHKGLAAMCHGLLPNCGCECGSCPEKMKYVECSIVHMINWFYKAGVDKSQIETKVFGGGDVLDKGHCVNALPPERQRLSVGSQNIKAALKVLDEAGFKISAKDVGGNLGRKMFFFTDNGEVLLRKIKKTCTSSQKQMAY
ncbi:chemotaxis protein CheD [Candidatus Magnetomonas plexicatena]|uniref:chemotaxis protein CheD n=1 Tax=Candidatus Magnetomonas plexicatena TaxID=2552947 RepID=UPI001C75EFDE|nr:chemotaxis protein CheD [Nitrospirales bacterium LBB_01]